MVTKEELKEKAVELLDALIEFETIDPELLELKDKVFSSTYKFFRKLYMEANNG